MAEHRSVKRSASTLDGLIARLPPDDPRTRALQARAAKYGRACGCSSGALFLVASVLLSAAYFAAGGELGLRSGLGCVVFVFVATLAGKLAGISHAALRLRLLRRSVDRTLRRQGRLGHVHVH